MAHATKKSVESRLVIADGFELRLSVAEAQVVMWILRRIGGDPVETPRRYSKAILKALSAAGCTVKDDQFQSIEGHHSIYFKEDRNDA